MNKKADISIMILVIGIVAICFLTILSFVKSDNDVDDNFLGVGLIETMDSIEEEINFYGETEFEGDYGNVFERGNVKIIIQGNTMEGSYVVTESNFPYIPYLSTKKEKTLVSIIYDK